MARGCLSNIHSFLLLIYPDWYVTATSLRWGRHADYFDELGYHGDGAFVLAGEFDRFVIGVQGFQDDAEVTPAVFVCRLRASVALDGEPLPGVRVESTQQLRVGDHVGVETDRLGSTATALRVVFSEVLMLAI